MRKRRISHLRWLGNDPPNFDEARQALRNIVRDGTRASDVIARMRAVLKKSEPAAQRLDLTWAMMLAGVGMLCVWQRSRRSKV
jgi:hypothetical protein